jgi:hypothetical protein
MIAPLDLFRQNVDGSVRWCGSYPTLEAGKAEAQKLIRSVGGDYFLFSQRTGNKLVIKAEPDPAI